MTMKLPRNAFKLALSENKLQIGLWCSLCSNIAADIVADSGFDWLLLDTEHSPNELPDIFSALQATNHSAAESVVRPAWNDAVLIKRYLDIGAKTLLIPFVQNVEEAERAVAATRYPPKGIRGVTGSGRASRFGRVQDYLKTASDEICVLVQLETPAAIEHIEAICRVDGVDGVFIGPNDLAASMGHIGDTWHADVQAALKGAARRIVAAGKPAGILSINEADTRRYVDWGYRFVAAGVDVVLLARATDALAKQFKSDRS
jgi:4-hydroxy-2-oxoheptanedioate aldolase